MRLPLTQERLKELLHYNAATGIFTRLKSKGPIANKGAIAGSIHVRGYRHIKIDSVGYKAHRLAFLYIDGAFPEGGVDHINKIKDDNSFSNLRAVSHSENMRNRKKPGNNTSGVVGVYWHRTKKYWGACISVNNRQKDLGCFDSMFDAVCARRSAELKYKYHANHGGVL